MIINHAGTFTRPDAPRFARRANVLAYVRNLPDGTVEIVDCGAKNRVDQLVSWCHKGPIMAQVSEVKTRKLSEEPGYDSFEIL